MRLHIFPYDVTLDVPEFSRLSDALQQFSAEKGCTWENACGGRGACGKCAVMVFPFGVSREETEDEESGVRRFACHTFVREDMTVKMPVSREAEKMRILTWAEKSALAETEREKSPGLSAAVDVGTTTLALSLIRNETGEVLGTTTRENPQRRFGHDVISRIQHGMTHGVEEMRDTLLEMLREMLAETCRDTKTVSWDVTRIVVAGNTVMEEIFLGLDVSSLGGFPFSPAEGFCGGEMSAGDACFGWKLTAGWGIRPETKIFVFPPISGFVGGDITAGIVASGMRKQAGNTLLMDVGTNGEIVLYSPPPEGCPKGGVVIPLGAADGVVSADNTAVLTTPSFGHPSTGGEFHHPVGCAATPPREGNLSACATAAGPAFEGAEIQFGMNASPGAVERVEINADGSVAEIGVIGGGTAQGICGSGMIDVTAGLLRCGMLTPEGKLLAEGGKFYLTKDVFLSQADFRKIQLAVGAISTGIRILLARAGVDAKDLDALWIAGGFGRYIRLENARRIGLFPREIPLENIRFLGNTALAGAEMAAVSGSVRAETLEIPKTAEAVDLAQDERFSDYFMESMRFR